jgi:hypothetical protein
MLHATRFQLTAASTVSVPDTPLNARSIARKPEAGRGARFIIAAMEPQTGPI